MSLSQSIAITIQSCDNFAIDTMAAVTLDAKPYPWVARVSSDIMVHVKLQNRDDERDGSLAFSGVAHDGDEIDLFWAHGSTTFTFGDGTGGTVDKGISATTSAQNLKAAINIYTAANAIDLTITGGAATLTFVTHDPFVHMDVLVNGGPVMTLVSIDYVSPATNDDAPFTEFRDFLFAVATGETLSFIGGEDNGFCSVSEVKLSGA